MALINPAWFTSPAIMISTKWGVPLCLTTLGADALKYYTDGGLGTLAIALISGRNSARTAISSIVVDIFKKDGILQYSTVTGKFSLFSQSSAKGFDVNWLTAAADWAGFINELESAYDQGDALIQELSQCAGEIFAWMGILKPLGIDDIPYTVGDNQYSENRRQASLGLARAQVQDALDFSEACTNVLDLIGTELYQRQVEAAEAELDEGPIFRLTYGPPIAKAGLFVLSEDGLYYDSQERLYNGKSIPSASDVGFVVNSDKWKLDHAPSLGGKGTVVSVEQLNDYVNTIFDISYIDDSPGLQEYYSADTFLTILEGQKDKLMYDTSSQITELLSEGYTEDSALVLNTRNSLYSVISSFRAKGNKRRKQIEVAVKAPDLFGTATSFSPGTIPVNDFSYLSSIGLNIAIDQQKALTFESGEVSGIVLPIKPKFVRNHGVQSNKLLSPLVVPPMGLGSIMFNPSIHSEVAPAISLTDSIATSGLFAVYNFLKGSAVAPSSTEYNVNNPVYAGKEGDGQLVGAAAALFGNGLGIPYLGGVARIHAQSAKLLKTGGYFRLPSNTEFQNLLYSPGGASIDCWVHIPYFGFNLTQQEIHPDQPARLINGSNGAWTDYNYYRILLGNENTGGLPQAGNVSSLVTANAEESTKGFLMGFTRDPVIFSDAPLISGPNHDPGQNFNIPVSATVASSCFFIAPTMSFGTSAVEFIPKTSDCSFVGYHKMTIPVSATTTTGKTFLNVSSTFVHLHVAFDVSRDKCTVYLDGDELATSAISDAFGVQSYTSPKTPTFIVPKDKPDYSFYYSSATVSQTAPLTGAELGQTQFDIGPQTDTYFTPWIVGGGWTAGYPIDLTTSSGGFMGNRHGYTAGLHGNVGSLKFYSRPLTNKEVKQNYDAQTGFFKNIDILSLGLPAI